ncbi:MAG: RIP metalloprotease RseP [[Eubacterium] brachy]|jgi:RIP metalloprotease RseP|nr:RIP metalloprotease RseP [Eubacterium brachy ATCC 33089]MBF1134039.1 RIP metalloprotease RseP [[Eubacterium] brachy]
MTIIYALLIICVLIFFHELGHFMAAKACGVKVNEFAIGMGPKVLKKQKGETLYSVRAFPLGGFCAMEGEDEDSQDERAFNRKSVWKKAIIIVAGAAMNLIIAIILMIAVNYMNGVPTTTISQVEENSPAYTAGIQKGDKILSINDKKINSWDDVQAVKNAVNTRELNIKVQRKDTELNIKTTLKENDRNKIIGIVPVSEKNIVKAIANGPSATWNMAKSMYSGLYSLITGKVSAKELSGPVGIVYLINKGISRGFATVLYLTSLISLNLAIINMLPLPALDGGRLLMVIIRRLTGKAISSKVEGVIHAVGLGLLLLLTIYVTWNDIVRFIVPIFK